MLGHVDSRQGPGTVLSHGRGGGLAWLLSPLWKRGGQGRAQLSLDLQARSPSISNRCSTKTLHELRNFLNAGDHLCDAQIKYSENVPLPDLSFSCRRNESTSRITDHPQCLVHLNCGIRRFSHFEIQFGNSTL